MKLIGIDETKYSLKKIIENKSSQPTTEKLLEEFHNKLRKILNGRGLFWKARTHVQGITYFCNEIKAFLMLNLTINFLSCKFFTGHGDIKGLHKGTWLNSGETCGSEMFRIIDDESLKQAIQFAVQAHGLAKDWNEKVLFG